MVLYGIRCYGYKPAVLLARLYLEYTFCSGGSGGVPPRRHIVINASVSISVDLSTRQPVFKG